MFLPDENRSIYEKEGKNMAEKTIPKDPDREMAYFRFAIIAPVIQGTFPDASAAAYCRRVTQNPLRRPDGTMFR
jgi:hypothetical protein